MINERLKNNYFIGIVEDNADPESKGRIRVRIPFLHGTPEEIPTDSLPWAHRDNSIDGKSFEVPEINKIISVYFPSGSPYMPYYKESLHLDINLQKKIETYSKDKISEFKAFCYDYNTRIYKDDEILSIGYKYNSLDINEDNIILALKDQNSEVKLGDIDADEQAILGTSFIEWFNTLLDIFGNGFICNGSPVAPNPNLVKHILQFKSTYELKFLSKHVKISKNNKIKSKSSDTNTNTGDKFKMTNIEKNVSAETLNNAKSSKENTFEPTPEGVDKSVLEEVKFRPVIGHKNGEDIFDEPIMTDDELNDIDKLKEISAPSMPEVKTLETPKIEKPKIKQNHVESEYADSYGDFVIYSDDDYDQEFEDEYSEASDIDFSMIETTSDNTIINNNTTPATANPLNPVNFALPKEINTSDKIGMVKKLEKYMLNKKYVVNKSPYVLNTVGIRNNVKESGKITNKFDDIMFVWYYDENSKVKIYEFKITTTPGFKRKQKFLPGGPDNKGVSTMWYGQFKFFSHLHGQNKNHPCLGKAATKMIRQKPFGDRYYTLDEVNKMYSNKKMPYAAVGLNIHASERREGKEMYNVDNWSEGCQVFKKGSDWRSFMALTVQQKNKSGKNFFLYTLISQTDFQNS